MEGLGDVKNYRGKWLLRLEKTVSKVASNRPTAEDKRSVPVPGLDEWSRNPVATVCSTASPKGSASLGGGSCKGCKQGHVNEEKFQIR